MVFSFRISRRSSSIILGPLSLLPGNLLSLPLSLSLSPVRSMASRLLSRSKTLALTLIPRSTIYHPFSPIAVSSQSLHSLASATRSRLHDPSSAASSSSPAISSFLSSYSQKELVKVATRVGDGVVEADCHLKEKEKEKEVICFSPLEATKTRTSSLSNESLKIKRVELSQKITFALIPALLLISKSSLTTSLLIFSVYWQIYGFFKEIFLDYIHHDVTRTWVLVYFKVLLLILAKDTIIHFGLV